MTKNAIRRKKIKKKEEKNYTVKRNNLKIKKEVKVKEEKGKLANNGRMHRKKGKKEGKVKKENKSRTGATSGISGTTKGYTIGMKRQSKVAKKLGKKEYGSLSEKFKQIMNDENLSKSKRKKLIKEHKRKTVVENYDYYKKLRIYLNELLQTEDKLNKKKQIITLYNELKKIELIKFARTNLGYHILSALIINGEEDIQNKLWKTLYKNVSDISTYHFLSLLFQCFYKHGKNKQIKNDIIAWILKNPKLYFTKFASRLWDIVFKKLKTDMKIKIINLLIIPNINIYKSIPSEILKKKTKEMVNMLGEENKMLVKNYLIEIIENIVEKELLYNLVSHNIILVACEILKEEELISVMEIIHEGCEYLISTNVGNKALICLLGYSTNKHKKILIKTLKNNIIEMCKNSVNFLLIIRLIKITDDTKLLNDFIVKKIVNNFEDIFDDYYGFYVILEFFYSLNEYKEDKYFHVDWKNMIYANAVKSIKDGNKRKSEIIQPIIDKLHILFMDKNKLNQYLKDKKYIIIIFEFLLYTQNLQVLNNLFLLIEEIICSHKNEENIDEMYNCNNINVLFWKISSYPKSEDFLHKLVDDNSTFCEKLCNLVLSNLETVLKSKLIKTLNNLLNFAKEKDQNVYEQILACTGQVNIKEIYSTLKETFPKLTHFERFLELTNQKSLIKN
ncbi:conserved Plasmodium protein, unknown function [Plasmodium ovale wallikeri]|uniref:PUM-HD domain-containing protein n=1 Tax=Plasmodium ovale wallikeri TaxID=864142 RepID=A0A1A8Z4W2_PLAOA|nr:conserved Plasmodium protein, unknown function [Plasmodium ovale wallikeri]